MCQSNFLFTRFCFVGILIFEAWLIGIGNTVSRVSVLQWLTLTCLAKCYNRKWVILVSCKQMETFRCKTDIWDTKTGAFSRFLFIYLFIFSRKLLCYFARKKLMMELQLISLPGWASSFMCRRFHPKRQQINQSPPRMTRCRSSSCLSFILYPVVILRINITPLVSRDIWNALSLFNWPTSLHPERLHHYLLLLCVWRRLLCMRFKAPMR